MKYEEDEWDWSPYYDELDDTILPYLALKKRPFKLFGIWLAVMLVLGVGMFLLFEGVMMPLVLLGLMPYSSDGHIVIGIIASALHFVAVLASLTASLIEWGNDKDCHRRYRRMLKKALFEGRNEGQD